MKIRLKKVVAALASVAIIASVGAACSKSNDSGTSGNTAAPTAAPAADTPAPAADKEETVADTPAPAEVTEAPAAVEPAEATEAPADDALLSEIPRNETVYFGGQQWDKVNNWNPYSSNANNAMAIAGTVARRVIMFETLYMYNPLTGENKPLLADGDYVWNADKTEVTVKINKAAKWNDGTPVTANDVAYTWATQVKYELPNSVNYGPYIEDIIAVDDYTVLFKAKLNDAGNPTNPLMIDDYIPQQYVMQKAWTETLEARANGNKESLMNDVALDVVSSGPYKRYFDDSQKVIFVRDDNYWGQDASLWGSLPVPKYLAHAMYADNAASQVGFEAGDIDCNQQFISNVQKLWEDKGLPISTYIDEPPYGICIVMPSIWYNFNNDKLHDVNLRKAIAWAVDYDQINQNAMTGQSPTFQQVPRSLMNPTPGEQALYDKDDPEIKALQWVGKDYDGANKLLDDAGYEWDANHEYRLDLDGNPMTFNVCCPNGWSDWMASVEIVAAAGKEIGINLTSLYPEWNIYQTVFTNGEQTEYDIFMYGGDASGPTYPWNRVRQRFSSEYLGQVGNWSGNWGQYTNTRVDEIIAELPTLSDAAEIKKLYTEAVKIYLEEVPSFAVMYRPQMFYAVNETYWTNFPSQDDGRGIPPTDLTDGYGIRGLYELELVK